MKHNLMRLGLAAAIIIAAMPAPAAGAGNTLTAKVEFTFLTPQTQLPAGEYQVTSEMRNGLAVFRLRSVESGKSAFVIATSPISPERNAGGDAQLVFRCAHKNCALSEVWTGYGATGYRIAAPALRGVEQPQVARVRMK
jgi:hypothetical protein